jgi:hypothetical protein
MQHLLEAKEEEYNFTDSLQVSYVAKSHLDIVTTQNERVKGKYKRSILLMKVDLSGKLDDENLSRKNAARSLCQLA